MTQSQAIEKQKAETIRELFENPAVKKQMQMAIPKHLTVDRLLRVAMTAVRSNPKLLDCTQRSLLAAVMGCAQLGLEPEPFLGQAYLVPFRNKGVLEAVLIPGYRGYIALARRSGEVQSVSAQVVYEKDRFELQFGLNEKLDHVPVEGDRGLPKGAYVVFRYKDGSHSYDYMSYEDIMKIKARSKSADEGPWVTDEAEMMKKTVIRRHVKLAPLAVEIQKAAYIEDRAMAGEGQFDTIFPELPEASAEPAKPFEELVQGKDVTGLEDFLAETAAANKTTVDQIKAEAAKDFDGFWGIFERWTEARQKAQAQQSAEKEEKKSESKKDPKGSKAKGQGAEEGKQNGTYIECPDRILPEGRKAKVSTSYCDKMCEKREGCPSYPESERGEEGKA